MTKQAQNNLIVGQESSVDFKVTAAMVAQFAALTGDQSSLHTSAAYGRRSMYRTNVVHGMLPLAFLTVLKDIKIESHQAQIKSLFVRFIKPIFPNDLLQLISKVIKCEDKQAHLEFNVIGQNTKAQLTTGKCVIDFSESISGDDKKVSAGAASVVLEHLTEENQSYEDIKQTDVKQFPFQCDENHLLGLYNIIREGLNDKACPALKDWIKAVDARNILLSSLSSTMVGMCLPGKRATFMDLNLQFHDDIVFGQTYRFRSVVEFKSDSTQTLVEKVTIEGGDSSEAVASGQITVKVNDAPVQMPKITELKKANENIHLKDKVVLVTGASRGIGEVTAKLFSIYGAKVAVNYYRGQQDAQRVVEEIKANGGQAIAVGADVTDRAQVQQMVGRIVREYGTIDVLVNNAVSNFYTISFMDLTWSDFQKDLDVIVKGAFNCCQEVLPVMCRQKEGSIINLSTTAVDNPPVKQAKYVTAKSALEGLTRSLAVEFGSQNIKVNLITPSMVETDLTQHIPKIVKSGLIKDMPDKRFMKPEEVAQNIINLAA